MDVDEADDDDEYEVVGYGGAPRAAFASDARAEHEREESAGGLQLGR